MAVGIGTKNTNVNDTDVLLDECHGAGRFVRRVRSASNIQHDVKNGRELGQRYAELECPVRIDGPLLEFSGAPHIVVQPQRTGIYQESE
jgi:hypothetical protein